MILTVPDFLDTAGLARVRQLFAEQQRVDGARTAGATARAVKRNVEMSLGERAGALKQVVLEACNRTPNLNYTLLPRTVSTPILSLYEPGMAYGRHVDSAVGNDYGRTYRTDISCTIFLEDPASYDGGELSIDNDETTREFKLPAGHAVFYPTLEIHQVLPVTRGERKACVFWIESMVRDPAKRALLSDMVQLCDWIGETESPESQHRVRANKVRANLYRRWMDT